MYKILIADDEIKIRNTIYDYMTAKGLEAKTAANGCEAVRLCENESFDLIILDVMMPELNGISACREIREITDCPVLFLSALGEEYDLLKGFSSGADDYIVKPFPLSVLYKKCLAMIRRYKNADAENKITAGNVTADLYSRTVTAGEREVRLSAKDFNLLALLMQNKNRVLSRELILTKIWGYDYDGEIRVVDTHIKRIRKALGNDADIINTAFGAGYEIKED